jgi:hypothetical protein
MVSKFVWIGDLIAKIDGFRVTTHDWRSPSYDARCQTCGHVGSCGWVVCKCWKIVPSTIKFWSFYAICALQHYFLHLRLYMSLSLSLFFWAHPVLATKYITLFDARRLKSKNFASIVELCLSGLIGTASHPDMQKIRIIRFFFENMLHWQFEFRLLLFTVCNCA